MSTTCNLHLWVCANYIKFVSTCISWILSRLLPLLILSGWRKMDLTHTCRGNVYVYSQGKIRSAVSAEGWTAAEGNRLCKDQNCGRYLSNSSESTTLPFLKTSFNCTGVQNPKNIWDCEKPTPPSLKQLLSITCQGEIYFCRSVRWSQNLLKVRHDIKQNLIYVSFSQMQ